MDYKNSAFLNPGCRRCETKDCSNCTQLGAHLVLTDPPIPWLGGEPLKRPPMPPPWEPFSWMKE